MEWNHHECTVSSHSHLNRRRLTGAVRVGEVFDRPALDPQRRRVGGEGRFQPRREAADGLLDPLRRRHVGFGQRHVLLRDVCTRRNKNTSMFGHKAADRTERSVQNTTEPSQLWAAVNSGGSGMSASETSCATRGFSEVRDRHGNGTLKQLSCSDRLTTELAKSAAKESSKRNTTQVRFPVVMAAVFTAFWSNFSCTDQNVDFFFYWNVTRMDFDF